MERPYLPRDKNGVLKPLPLPAYSAERNLDQRGDWVLIAVMKCKSGEVEGVPVLDYADRTYLQRYQSLEELRQLAYRNSAVRVGGGRAVNLRNGRTEWIPARGKADGGG